MNFSEAIEKIQKENQALNYWLFSNEPEEAIKYLPLAIRNQIVIVPDFSGSSGETLEAMRHANHYILGNSSLSWWGAFLSYETNPQIICPQPWFKLNVEPSKLIPQNWVRIRAWDDSITVESSVE
jgi:hypothetical protein